MSANTLSIIVRRQLEHLCYERSMYSRSYFSVSGSYCMLYCCSADRKIRTLPLVNPLGTAWTLLGKKYLKLV